VTVTGRARRSTKQSLDLFDEDPREGRDRAWAVSEEAAQSLRHGDHPLPHGHRGNDAVDEMRSCLRQPLVYSRAASCSPNFDDARVVFAATLVMPGGLGCTIWGAEELLDAAAAADMLAWENSGFSVDASVRITLIDRDVPSYFQSLEHLLRYCARPPFALERLSVIRGPAGRIAGVRYVLPRHKAATWVGPGRGRKSTRPGANGVVELTPFEFLDRLADLVPPPRKHRHRYHGVFAPNHKLRKAVTALAIGNIGKPREAANGGHGNEGRDTGGCCDAHRKPRSHDTSRIAWAKLMARVGEEFPLECPACGGDIRLIAFITEPGTIRKILTHLGEPLEPPPVSPARGPPTDWHELVQVHDDGDVFQSSPEELPAIDIHSL
jgi:hypothetical protein